MDDFKKTKSELLRIFLYCVFSMFFIYLIAYDFRFQEIELVIF